MPFFRFWVFDQLNRIENSLDRIERKIMADAATIQQVDAEIQNQTSLFTTLAQGLTKVDGDVQALISKVQSGQVSTPQDFTAELTALQQNTATLQSAISKVTGTDAAAQAATNPPPTPPPTTPPAA